MAAWMPPVFPSLPPVAAAAPPPADTPLQRDPREDADWFQRLPPTVQDEFRARWRQDVIDAARYEARMRRYGRRSLVEGAAVMVFMQLITWPGLWRVAVAVAVGAAMGWAWHRAKAGRAHCMLLGLLAWTLEMAICGGGFTGMIKMLPASVLFLVACTVLGIVRESWYRNDALGW